MRHSVLLLIGSSRYPYRSLRAWLLTLLLLLPPVHAPAATLYGADDPALHAAVQTWLDDDDERSLPVLARLAAQGNIAAALLVARIERTTKHFSPWLHSLSRKQRLSLFRRPMRYKFAPSWIGWYAYKGLDLAVALEDAGLSRTDAWLVHELHDLGELQATDPLIRRIAFYGNGQQRAQIAGANLPLSELDPYVLAMDQPGTDSRFGLNALVHMIGHDAVGAASPNEVDKAAQFLHNGLPFERLSGGHPLHQAIAHAIDAMPALRPIARQCDAICPNDTEQCSVTMLGLQGGYYEAIRNDSPLESVISQPRYLSSRRAAAIALRRAALARDGAATHRASLETIWRHSQCLGVAVRKVREEHVPLFR